MSGKLPTLSIVCPAYEEEEALPRFHDELLRVVDDLGDQFEVEIVYVDDGSRDGTLPLLRRWARGDRRVRYLSFTRNFGHQAAVAAGLEHARGDLVVTLDSDLQHPPGLIPVLIERWRQGYDVVATVRADDPALGWFKRLSSRAFYAVMRRLSETEVRPAAADFRLMSRRAVQELLRLRESHRFLRGLVPWLGFPTAEVAFEPARRAAGRSKYTLRSMVAFASDGLVSFSRLPLRLPLVLGAALLLAGVALAGITAVGGMAEHAATVLPLVALHLIGGAVLCGVGIVGEYVGRIFDEVRGRPLYVLKETEADGPGARARPAPVARRRGASAA